MGAGRASCRLRREPGHARLTVVGQPPSAGQTAALVRAARHILRLDDDLSPFYALIHRDPDLA